MNKHNKVKVDSELFNLIKKIPDKSITILSNVMYDSMHFIHKLELSLYITNKHISRGEYSILIVSLKTNKGTIIMKYDEGYRGRNVFDDSIEILTYYNGLSSLINRAFIELDQN